MQKKVDRVNMIVSRLLEMKTVGLDLMLRLPQDNFPSQGLPMFCPRDFRAQHPEKEQRDRFSQQMRIRRKIGRQVTLNMAAVQSLGTKPFFSEFSRHDWRAFQQLIHPNPGKTTKRHLETADPVDSKRVWILGLPVPPLPEYLVCITPLFGKPIRFGQSDQMLMTVQFPRDLAIPNLVEVEITDLVESLSGSLFPMYRVEMPIDGIAVFQILVAEKIKMVTADFVGLANDVLSLLRKSLTNYVRAGQEEMSTRRKTARSYV